MKRLLPIGVALAGLGLVVGAVLWPSEPPPEPIPRLGHFSEFQRLERAAWTGDLPLAAVVARDLTAGEEGVGAEDAEARIGGALGFIGFAEDGEELAEAVTVAASGCGSCHVELAVSAPPRPPWTHHLAAEWLFWGLVWGDDQAPMDGSELSEIAMGYRAMLPMDTGSSASEHTRRVARTLQKCTPCHAHTTALAE